MSKTIIITENMATNLNEELSITRFKFKSNMKKFIAGLLEDPVGADPGLIFTSNGLDKNTLIKALVDNMVIRKKMVIDDHDADGNPHTAKMIVRYSVPKKRFNDKLESLFDVLFPNAETKIQLDEDGATSCGSVDGNGFGSGEFIQPLDLKKHKNGITKKTVGGDAFSEKITQNESITGTDIDKSAALYVYNCDNKGKWYILCAQRSNRKNDEEGGKWNPPMGHLHKHETLKEGALRECLEESGIDFSKYREQIKQNDKQPWGANFVLKLGNNVKPCVTIDDFQPKKGDEENGKFIWLPIEDIDKKTWAWTCGENAKKFINNNLNESTQLLNEAVKLEKALNPFAIRLIDYEDLIAELAEIMMEADPTAYSNDYGEFAGKYYTWLGNQYVNDNIDLDDVEDLKHLLSAYDKNSKEIGVPINQIGNLNMLRNLVTPYMGKNSNQKRDISKGEQALEKVYDDQNFTVYIPHTYKASRKIAGDTNWCTASSDGGETFYQYLEDWGGYYYVIVSKKNPSDKWQLHVESEQFQYKDSTDINFGNLGTKAEVEPLIRFFQRIGLDVSEWEPEIWPDEVENKVAQGYKLKDIFDSVYQFSEGYAVVKLNGRWNFIDKNKRLFSHKWFDYASSFSEGYAVVKLEDGQLNFIDVNNRFLSDKRFETALPFREGYAAVKLDGQWYFIDKNCNYYDYDTKQPLGYDPHKQNNMMNEAVQHLLTEAVKLDKAIKPFAKQMVGDEDEIQELQDIMMQADPTAYSNNFGQFAGDYYTWLGNQYMNGNIGSNDVTDLRRILDAYDKNNKEIGVPINQIGDLDLLIDLVRPYLNKNSNQNRDISKGEQELEKVYDDQNFTVYIPHTYRASRKIAGDTSWCTASSDGGQKFNEYLEDYGGQYYVIVSKKNPSDKWQLHAESEQFQYKDSSNINFCNLGTKAEVEPLIRFFQSIGLDVSLWLPKTWPDELEYKLAQGYKLYDIFDGVESFIEGYARVELNDRWNFIDKNNSFLSDEWFDYVLSFSEGYAVVVLNDRWNFIDKNNRMLSDKWFDYVLSFSEGYAVVRLKNRWNFIDKNNSFLSDEWFDYVLSFSEGYAVVKVNGRWNFIDKNNRLLSDEWFDYAYSFSEGYAVVVLNDRCNFVDRNGNYYDYNTKQPLGYDPHKPNNMMNESILTKYINNVVRQIIKETKVDSNI